MAAPPQAQGADELADLVTSFRNDPESLAFWPLARGRLAAGRMDDAIELLRYGLMRHPEHRQARLALARSLLGRASFIEATTELLVATETEPENAHAHILLAEALDGAGDAKGACTALERACALAPDDELAAFLLEQLRGRTHRRLGRLSLGKKKLATIVEERHRTRDSRGGESDTPSKPPRGQFSPENPFAPLPPADWSDAPSRPSGSSRPSGAVRRPSPRMSGVVLARRARRRRTAAWIAALGFVVAGGIAAYQLRDSILPGPAPVRVWTAPPALLAQLATGRPADYKAVREAATAAGAKGGAAALALQAQSHALALLEYGEGDVAAVDAVITAAAGADKRGDSAGLAIARAALALARLPVAADADQLAPARAAVDHALALAGSGGIPRWLDGVARLAAGDREGARAAFVQADGRGTGPVQAAIAIADMTFDDGELDAARSIYEAVLARAPGHPWAMVGHVAVELERAGGDGAARAAANQLVADLERAGATTNGRRLSAWVKLLSSRARGAAPPDGIDGIADARLARARGLFAADRGELVDAARLRARLGDGDPALTAPLEAALELARGLPDEARSALGTRGDARARRLRGLAYLDLGRPVEAEAELGAARSLGADDGVVALQALAALRAGRDKKPALATLELLAAAAPGGIANLALGEAQLALGSDDAARRSFAAVAPAGPWAYRADVRLAELDLAEFERGHDQKKLAEADAAVHRALDQAPDYLPARAIVGRLLVHAGQAEGALAAFGPVVAAGREGAADDLALADAYIARGDREQAKAALRRALEKGASIRDVRPRAEKVDRTFAAGLPAK